MPSLQSAQLKSKKKGPSLLKYNPTTKYWFCYMQLVANLL
jgi:hypothetical protein